MAGGPTTIAEAWPPVAALEAVSHAAPEELARYLVMSVLGSYDPGLSKPSGIEETERIAGRLVRNFQEPDFNDPNARLLGAGNYHALAAAAQVEIARRTYRAFGYPAPEDPEGAWYKAVLYPGTVAMPGRSPRDLAMFAALTPLSEVVTAGEKIVRSMTGPEFKTPEPEDSEPTLSSEERGLVAATHLILATTVLEKFNSGDAEGDV